MHKSSVRFGKKKLEVRFDSGSAKNSWFGRFLLPHNVFHNTSLITGQRSISIYDTTSDFFLILRM